MPGAKAVPKEAKILTGIAVIVIIGGVLLFLKGNPQPDAPSQPVDSASLVREGSHMTGTKDAKVTVVEFGDYQCPYCASINPAVAQLIKNYRGNSNVNVVFRNFPLSQHINSQVAAEAAEAAGAQGKFWDMHDKIYEKQADWENSNSALDIFVGYANELGLDVTKFRQDVGSNKFAEIIKADLDDGVKLGVDATPTFFINGQKQAFIANFDELDTKVSAALK